MPDSVTEVYYSDGCKNLSKVRLSKNLLTIDSTAFRDCAALREIVFPESVKTIGERAFSGCISLKHVYFMGDLPEIGWLSFADSNAISDFAAIPGMVFYYREGTSGWGPTVFDQTLSYPTAVWTTAPYTDASPDSWYASAVRYTYDNGLMNGTGEYSFEPESSMTRAMLVTVLWRYAGQPQAAANPFTDVPGGEWYTQAVAWAAENGVVNGIGGGKFDPNGRVTREQAAAILFRYAQKVGAASAERADLSGFPDANAVSDYASDAMRWVVAEGIIGGSREYDGRDWLKPQGSATRAQVAAILMRYIENVTK